MQFLLKRPKFSFLVIQISSDFQPCCCNILEQFVNQDTDRQCLPLESWFLGPNMYAFLNRNNVFGHPGSHVSPRDNDLDRFTAGFLISSHQYFTCFYVYFKPMSLHTHTHTHTRITKEIWISLCLPATNSAVSRKAKPNARSLSHRYMVISGNQPNSRETACVLLKGKIMVISEPVFLCWAESRRREVNAYSSTGVLSDRGGFLLLPWEQTTCCEAVMSDSVLLTSPKGLQRVLFAGSQESCSKSLPRPLTSLIQVDWVTRLLKRFSLKKDAFFVSK